MKIVLAPDSFKGSASAVEVCAAMKRGIQKVIPDAQILEVPLADGGEGTLDALLLGAGGFRRTVRVHGPLDESIEADWGFLPDGTAIIELSQASGLTLTPPEKRSALRASTFGTGQLIRAALDAGARRFFLGLGGSATTDGATGLLSALGARFFDERDCVLPAGGGDLSRLARIDLQFFDQRLQKCQFIALCDVTNPLCGPNGAAHIFSPQKGATPEQVLQLDASLAHYAEITAQHFGCDLQNRPGAGAAGGTGFGLVAYLNAQMQPGIEAVLQATEFAEKLEGADLVLTGEGSLDSQTLSGKTIAGVCRTARTKSVPTIALGGRIALSCEQLDELGLKSAVSIVDGPRELEWCLDNALTLIEYTTERLLRIMN
ncbi:glycerate kinase [bacterium]|nr:MAG: glycerate kinase [bacterium]